MIAAARGFVLSVLAAAVVGLIVAIIGASIDGTFVGASILVDPVLWVMFAYLAVISALALGLFGVPLTAVLSRWRIERSWSYPVFGFLIGAAVADSLFNPAWYNRSDFTLQTIAQLTAIGGSPGCAAGIVWWHSYRKSRTLNA